MCNVSTTSRAPGSRCQRIVMKCVYGDAPAPATDEGPGPQDDPVTPRPPSPPVAAQPMAPVVPVLLPMPPTPLAPSRPPSPLSSAPSAPRGDGDSEGSGKTIIITIVISAAVSALIILGVQMAMMRYWRGRRPGGLRTGSSLSAELSESMYNRVQ